MSTGSAIELIVDRLSAPVEGMHHAIARKWFDALSPIGEPVRFAHDAIAGLVYGSVRLAGAATGVALETLRAPDSQRARRLRSVVNGLWGDGLGRNSDRLAIPMQALNADGELLPVAGTASVVGGRLVVLVHGLAESETTWRSSADQPGLLARLDDHPLLTPILIRYNSGLPVARNGRELADLLAHVVAAWPVPVESIALVGHSMGGLVTVAATTEAQRLELSWLDVTTSVVSIGTPHAGAPLEKLAAAAAWTLEQTAVTRPLADFVNGRSAGIKDLRHGVTDDEGLPAHVDRYAVAGAITASPEHPLAAAIGDLMVRPASAVRPTHGQYAEVAVVGQTDHFELNRSPTVIDQVMSWISD